MKELLEKISSYNLFNYLFPGAVFGFWINKISGAGFSETDVFTGAFLYYFLGLIVSRFGSLAIEPLTKWLKIVKFEDYKDYVAASKKDPMVATLSEVNNMYRTLISLAVLIGLFQLYLYIETKLPFLIGWRPALLVIALVLIFVLSYRKQTQYISKRIKANLNE